MLASLIDVKTLTITPIAGKSRSTHQVKKALIPGLVSSFYYKEMKSASIARNEVLAQEFFRLIIVSQPEMRLACDSSSGTYVVLSEEVPGYENIPINSHQKFSQGLYSGLGQIMIASVFLQEIDLKNGNIGLNHQNKVVKIDGDWCFAAIRDLRYKNYKKDITLDLVTCLPFPVDYHSFNWLDLWDDGVPKERSQFVDVHLVNAIHFRNEINEAILKMLVLPDFYIHRFVEVYVPAGAEADQFIRYLKDRREELNQVALQESSFQAYLATALAQEVLYQHLIHMKNFRGSGEVRLIKYDEYILLDNEVMRLHNALIAPLNIKLKVNNIAKATNTLNSISVDFTSLKSKAALFHHREHKLKQINECIVSLTKPKEGGQLIEYEHLIQCAQEKRKQIDSHANRLEPRFALLKQANFDKHLCLFMQKKKEMSTKTRYNLAYVEAAKSAALLCVALEQAEKKFLGSEQALEQAKNDFNDDCIRAVLDARVVLDHHREWYGIIRKFIMDVISFLTAGWINNKLSLFAKTDSARKLDDLEYALNCTNNSIKV